MNDTPYHHQNGNVLFFILIAVALFAALSYAVTKSSRSGGGSSDKENLSLAASQITQYGSALTNAISRMRLYGCTDTEISFESQPFDGSDTDYTNANAPSDFSCHVFHPNGGGVSEQTPDLEWLTPDKSARPWFGDYVYIGRMCVDDVGTHGHPVSSCSSGIDGRDLTLNLPYLKESLCSEIVNNETGSSNIPIDASRTYSVGGTNYFFRGNYNSDSSNQSIDNTSNNFSGQHYLCYGTTNTSTSYLAIGEYAYYHVLLAR